MSDELCNAGKRESEIVGGNAYHVYEADEGFGYVNPRQRIYVPSSPKCEKTVFLRAVAAQSVGRYPAPIRNEVPSEFPEGCISTNPRPLKPEDMILLYAFISVM